MEVGKDLNIESLQDKETYDEKNNSSGFNFSVDVSQPKGKPATYQNAGITGGKNKGKINSTYESVTDQAGIYAGKGGFDIEVGKNTDLKGAVIASEADASKNKLSTDTLTYSDIENRAEYESSSSGINVNTKPNAKDKDKGITPNIGVTSSDEADSTTKSAIAEGTIEIRSNPDQDLTGLSRDTQNSLNTLEKIFDRKTVAEQQELAQLFGQVAFKAIGDLGLKEGSPEKAALDIVFGGIMSKVGGGKFAEGAASAGLTQLVMNELKNIKDPALLQWATAIVGAAAAKVVGGKAQTGASVAVSEVKNNWLFHWQKEERQKAIDEEDWEKVAYWDRIDEAQDQIFNSMGINPNLIDWTDPINSKLLESISNQAQELEASSNFQNSFLENLPTVDYPTIIAAGSISVVVGGAVLYKYNGSWVKASSPIAIGVGKWGEATFQNESKLVDHFVRHGKEWGNITKTEYVQKARNLLNSNVEAEIEGFTNNLGYTFRYNKVTNEFAIGHPNGTISTMMRPNEGRQYWLEQVAKYADL